jgi:NAD(P)-dependent dehydrogenase (short-subunit alcohol dehydrogenase family)
MSSDATLVGHVALVTGASRGIGRAISRRLAAHGCAVIVTASPRSLEGLQQTCKLIEEAGGRAASLTADLANADARADLVSRAAALLGPIDILVNNAAAIPSYNPPSRMPLAARQQTFEINFQAPVDLIQQALPSMSERSWGRIVNISSETVKQPPIPYAGPAKQVHALTVYGASKAALERYTLGLAAELHGSGVQVNALAPHKIALSESAEAVARQLAEKHPDWIESLEMMAEACYQLIVGSYTGLLTSSRNLLQTLQCPLHALDGRTVIGDALTIARVD